MAYRRFQKVLFAVFFAAIFFLTGISGAFAKTCGGTVSCSCGDTVKGSYTMSSDLRGCFKSGLILSSNAKLDCGGHTIASSGASTQDTHGILIRSARNSSAANCLIEGFGSGVTLKDARGAALENIRISNAAKHGFSELQNSSGNTLQKSSITKSGGSGIYIASGSGEGSKYIENRVSGSGGEGVYVVEGRGGTFEKNIIESPSSDSLHMRDSSRWTFEGNTFKGGPAVIAGGSQKNTFSENTFVNARIRFLPYSRSGSVASARLPSGNTVTGGTMRNSGSCFDLEAAPKNTVSNIKTLECNKPIAREGLDLEEPVSKSLRTLFETYTALLVEKINGFFLYVGNIPDDLPGFWRGVGNKANAVLAYAKRIYTQTYDGITGTYRSLTESPTRAVSNGFTRITSLPSRVWNKIVSGVSDIPAFFANYKEIPKRMGTSISRPFVYVIETQSYALPAALWWTRIAFLGLSLIGFGMAGFTAARWMKS